MLEILFEISLRIHQNKNSICHRYPTSAPTDCKENHENFVCLDVRLRDSIFLRIHFTVAKRSASCKPFDYLCAPSRGKFSICFGTLHSQPAEPYYTNNVCVDAPPTARRNISSRLAAAFNASSSDMSRATSGTVASSATPHVFSDMSK